MVRWIEIDVNSYWDPNRFVPHSGLFEGVLGHDRVMIHSWAERVPKGLGFCTKSVGKIDLSRILQRHLFIREQYMFWFHDKGDLLEIDLDGTRRFLATSVVSEKLVYLPFFRIPPGHHFSNIIHTEKWLEFQDFVSSEFEHEFYFDYNGYVDKAASIKALRRQINIDDLL